jgi:hypothetical protein
MQQKLDELREDLAALELVAEDERESTLSSVRHDLELIEADLDRVRDGNVSEGARLYKKVSDAKAEVGRAKSEYRVEIAYCKAVAEIEDAERIADMVRSFADARAARSLRTEAERAKAAEDSVALLNIAGRAEEIFWPLYVKTPDCWLSYVNYLRSHAADCCDAAAYHERLLKAEDCAVDGDYLGARLHCAKASDMLPRTLQRSERFADAGLRLGRPGAPL